MAGSVGERAAKSAVWNVASSLATRGLSLVGTMVLTRFIAPAEFGELSAASICVLTSTMITHLRFGQFLIAKQSTKEAAFQANVVHVLLGAVGVGIVYLLRDQLGLLVDAPAMGRFVPGFILTAMIDRLSYIPERTLVRDLRFRPLSLARSAGEVTFVAVSLGLASSWGGMAVVAANVARAVVATGLILRSARRADYAKVSKPDFPILKEMLAYCLPLNIGGFAEFAAGRWDNLLVSRYFGPGQMGLYNLAYNLADTPTGTVGEQISDVLFPSLAQLEENRRVDALIRATKMMALIVFPLTIGLAAIAPTAVRVFFDKRWLPVTPMLVVLSIASVAKPVTWPLVSFMQASHRSRAMMTLQLLKIVLLLGSIVLFARYGSLWTCVAVGATFCIHALAYLTLLRILDGVSMTRFLFGLVPVAIACAVMYAGVWGTRSLLAGVSLDATWLDLGLEIVVGAVVYIAASFVVARPIANDLIEQLRRTIQKRRAPAAA